MIPAKPYETKRNQEHRQKQVAAYCRVSTEQEEQQSSFEAQVEYYTDTIQKNPEWHLVEIFADDGISGVNAHKRKDFMRMIRWCKQDKIDLILTKSISRFSRNSVDCLHYVRMLKDLGVAVIFEKEGINTSVLTSEIILAMQSAFAQAESESLSKNVSWGIRKSYANGKVTFRYNSLLGYSKGPDGNPEIDPEQGETVNRIFNSILAGKSLDQIKSELERDGIKTARGKEIWSKEGLKNILRNERYIGDALLQKTYVADFLTKKAVKNYGELPQYYVSNNHPAIIDRVTFDRVQEELARRSGKRKVSEKNCKTEQGKYSSKFALTELLICGECGTPYRRVTWAKNGKKKVVWRCINRLDYGTKYCKKSPTVEESMLHDAIMNTLTETFINQTEVIETQKTFISQVLQYGQDNDGYILQCRINQLKDKMMELVQSINNSSDDKYDIQFQEISDEIKTLQARQEERKSTQSSRDMASARLTEIFSILDQLGSKRLEYDDSVIRQLLECVKVMSLNKIIIIMKGGREIEASLI